MATNSPRSVARLAGMGKRLLIVLAILVAGVLLALVLKPRVAIPDVQEPPADFVLVDKSDRRLELWRGGAIIRSYQVALGGNPEGPKRQEGDQRTPEGDYVIDHRNPASRYHLSLHISYPNAADRAASDKLGVPPGGDIFIHGLPNAWPASPAPKLDWTLGCIALDNAEIEEIWSLVPDGTPIRILP
jgi:murein L,D-transpeptidase YafK